MGKLYFGGIPTGSDVDRLLESIRVESGTTVDARDVERIIASPRASNRFRSVTNAWRRKLHRERALQSKMEGGVFVFLTASQAVDIGVRDMHRVGRAAGRVHANALSVDVNELTEEKRALNGLLVRGSQAIVEQCRKEAKVIAGPRAVTTTLRIAK